MRPFGTECRVVPVAGVDPRVIPEPVKDFGLEVIHQTGEVLGASCPSRTAGEQAVATEYVREAVGIVIQQRDGARCMTSEVYDLEFGRTDPDAGAIVDAGCDGDGQPVGVGISGDSLGTGFCDDFLKRLPVVRVLMSGDYPSETAITDEFEDGAGIVRRIDEHLFVCRLAGEQVCVVVHRSHGDLGDHEIPDFASVGWSADLDFAGVAHQCSCARRSFKGARGPRTPDDRVSCQGCSIRWQPTVVWNETIRGATFGD